MHFDILPCTHFVVIAGSHAYGTNTPESDLDVKGWAIPPTNILLSYIHNFEQNDTKETLQKHPFRKQLESYLLTNKFTCQVDPVDSTIYNLKKFFALAADCNPNIIDLLFTKESEIIWSDYYGDEIRAAAPLFLSQRARYSFTGYAVSQLKRIHTHRRWITNPPKKKPEREDYGLPCSSLIPPDQRQAAQALIEKQVRLWLLEEAEVDKVILDQIQDDLLLLIGSILDLKTREEARERVEYVVGKNYGMSEEYLSVLQREKKYKSALNEFNSYQNWLENRNPARAQLEYKFSIDTKHASHLCRLLVEAKEILEKGTLTLKQPEHVEFFKAIRNGAWTFDKLLEWATENMAMLTNKDIKCAVPKTVDSKKLDQIYRDLVLSSMEEEEMWYTVQDNEEE